MFKFNNISIYIYDGKRVINDITPTDLPSYNYVQLNIVPTSNLENIDYIIGTYVYSKDNQITIKFNLATKLINQFSNNPGYNLSYVLEQWWLSLNYENRSNIENLINDITLANYFSMSIAEILLTYRLFLEDQNEISDPFYPFDINFPISTNSQLNDIISSIDKCHLRWLSIFSRLYRSINTKNIGKRLLLDISDFYNSFSTFLPKGKNCDLVDALTESLSGYLNYINGYTDTIDTKINQLGHRYNNLNNDLANNINKITQDTITQINNKLQELQVNSSTLNNELNNKYKDVTSNIDNRIVEHYKNAVNNINKKGSELSSNIESAVNAVHNNLYNEFKSKLNDDLESINNSVKELIDSELTVRINNILNSELANIKLRIYEETDDIIQDKLNSVNDGILKDLSTYVKEAKDARDIAIESQNRIQSYINQIGSMAKDLSILEQRITKLENKDLNDSNDNIELTKLRNDMNSMQQQMTKINRLLKIQK